MILPNTRWATGLEICVRFQDRSQYPGLAYDCSPAKVTVQIYAASRCSAWANSSSWSLAWVVAGS